MRKEEELYREKIKTILENKIESRADSKKAIEDVKTWLCCEWQCDQISAMAEYTMLLGVVDDIAEEILKTL